MGDSTELLEPDTNDSTIRENIRRISDAKDSIRQAIIDKGVPVSSKLRIDEYADKIAQISGGGGGGTDNPGGIAGQVTMIEPASVQFTPTGITSVSVNGSRTIRDALFNILDGYFPNLLHTVDFGDQYGIAAYDKTASNCLYIDTRLRDGVNYFCMENNDWGQQRNSSFIFHESGGELAIASAPIKDGVAIAFIDQSQSMPYFYKAFTKITDQYNNDYVLYWSVDSYYDAYSTTREYLSMDNMGAEQWPEYYNNARPLAAPQTASNYISMSKLIINNAVMDDMFVATTVPGGIFFEYDDERYIVLGDLEGYCPLVLRYTGEVRSVNDGPSLQPIEVIESGK